MLVAYPLPDKGYRYSIRRGSGLFIMRMGVWRCPLEDRQEHHSTLFCITTKSQIGNGGDIKKQNVKKIFSITSLAACFCGNFV